MTDDRASLTALGTSMMRAIHTRLDHPPLIEDPWGDRLVSETERQALSQAGLAALAPPARERLVALALDDRVRAHPTYAWVIVRARYAEDALEAAVSDGTRQYVIIGAGMDSFALRSPAYARDVQVFEVDRSAMQQFKRQRLSDCGVGLSERLHFVPADLSQERLDAVLARSHYSRDRPAFFSWLGVSTYLTREANIATLEAISRSAAPGSELVFTYIDQGALDPDPTTDDIQVVRETLVSIGEPWVSGFRPAQLEQDLRSVGLVLVEDLGGEGLGARYCADRDDALFPPAIFHIARARIE